MALSYIESYGNGAQLNFSFASLQLLDDDLVTIGSQLKVYVDGTLKTQGVDYSVNIVTENIQFASAPLSTQLIRIARSTKSDERYVTYTNSTNVTAELLNTDALQLFFLAQEAKDLQLDTITIDTDGKWNAQSKVIKNVATGTNGTDAVNVAQLQAATLGVTPAALGGYGYISYTGDGTSATFTLPAQITSLTSAEDIQVYISGVYQTPNTAYTISGGNITFTPAPSNGAKIEILWLQGILSGIPVNDSVSTASLINGSVTVAKMNSGAAVAGTVAKADGSGGVSFGTVTSSAISNFDTAVRTSRLDQMAAPQASVSMGSQKITNLLAPTASTDGANKAYVDGYKQSKSGSFSLAGTTSSVSGNITFTGISNVCQLSLIVPYKDGVNSNYFNVTIPIVSSFTTNPSNPIIVRVPSSDNTTNGGTFYVYFTRSGASNNTFALTFTKAFGNDADLLFSASGHLTAYASAIGEI